MDIMNIYNKQVILSLFIGLFSLSSFNTNFGMNKRDIKNILNINDIAKKQSIIKFDTDINSWDVIRGKRLLVIKSKIIRHDLKAYVIDPQEGAIVQTCNNVSRFKINKDKTYLLVWFSDKKKTIIINLKNGKITTPNINIENPSNFDNSKLKDFGIIPHFKDKPLLFAVKENNHISICSSILICHLSKEKMICEIENLYNYQFIKNGAFLLVLCKSEKWGRAYLKVYLINVKTGKKVLDFYTEKKNYKLPFNKNGTLLLFKEYLIDLEKVITIVKDRKNPLHLYRLIDPNIIIKKFNCIKFYGDPEFNKKGSLIFIPSRNRKLKVVHLKNKTITKENVFTFEDKEEEAYKYLSSNNNTFLLLNTKKFIYQNATYLINLKNNTIFKLSSTNDIESFHFINNDQYLFCINEEYLIDLKNNKSIPFFGANANYSYSFYFNNNKRFFIINVPYNQSMKIMDVSNGKTILKAKKNTFCGIKDRGLWLQNKKSDISFFKLLSSIKPFKKTLKKASSEKKFHDLKIKTL